MKKRVILIEVLIVLFSLTNVLVDAEGINEKEIKDKYEIKSISESLSYMNFNNSNNELLDEVIAKRKAMSEYKVLLPKTNSEYELHWLIQMLAIFLLIQQITLMRLSI